MLRLTLPLALFAACAFAQTPTITTIQNNYARIAEGASNYGIAQGSIFIVKGTNLTDQTEDRLQNTPLQTTLKNVRMRINMGGNTYYAPIYYLLPTQLAGIMPSNVPEGTGTLVVENNGRNSAPAALKVVKSAFGMLAWDFENGTGRAIVVRTTSTGGFGGFAGDSATGTTNALNPNDIVLLYGSGLGPINGNDALDPTPTNMDNIPITITVGGVNAEVLYRGRSTFAGLDQINVRVPALAVDAYNCNVPMIITTNGVAANTTTVPVAANGTTCTNPNPGGGGGGGGNTGVSITENERNTWISQGFFRTGAIGIGRSTAYSFDDTTGMTTVTKQDSFSADFTRVGGADLGRFLRGEYPPGYAQYIPTLNQCIVYNTIPPDPYPLLTRSPLDAGPSVTSNGPNGTQIAVKTVQVGDINYIASNVPDTYMASGRYTFTGNGGPDVGAFTGTLDVPTEFRVTDAPEAFKTINRNAPVTVHWTGGDPETPVHITGSSFTISAQGVPSGQTVFTCMIPNTAGQFSVPSSVLSQLPVSPVFSGTGFSILFRGSFAVATTNRGNRVSIPNIEYGTAANQWGFAYTPEYK